MEKLILIVLIGFLTQSLGAQEYSTSDSLDEKEFPVYHNTVDSVGPNLWVTIYDLKDQIDTIQFFPKLDSGLVRIYNTKRILLSVEIYQHDSLPYPTLGSYTSKSKLSDSEQVIYDGINMGFPHLTLKKKVFYYENGKVKEIQRFKKTKVPCEVVTFHSVTFEPTSSISTCIKLKETGTWEWFDQEGHLTKSKDYSSKEKN